VRDRRAAYRQSLTVLRHAKEVRPDVVTKSSIMLGLGEEPEEVHQALADLKDAGVQVVTFGQYLQPTSRHMKVSRFVTPEEFEDWKKAAEALGLHCASGPLVRSSYKAGELYKAAFGEIGAGPRDVNGAADLGNIARAIGAGPREVSGADLGFARAFGGGAGPREVSGADLGFARPE